MDPLFLQICEQHIAGTPVIAACRTRMLYAKHGITWSSRLLQVVEIEEEKVQRLLGALTQLELESG